MRPFLVKEWPLSVPHSEHPCAYKKQNTYVVKFLEPQDLYSARWTESRSSRCSISSSAGSERIPSSAGTPATVALSASPGSPTDIGSPIISPASFEIKKQTGRPVYEFQQDKGEFDGRIRDHRFRLTSVWQITRGF